MTETRKGTITLTPEQQLISTKKVLIFAASVRHKKRDPMNDPCWDNSDVQVMDNGKYLITLGNHRGVFACYVWNPANDCLRYHADHTSWAKGVSDTMPRQWGERGRLIT